MEIGFLTACLEEVSLSEIAHWAAESGFKALEVPCRNNGSSWCDGPRIVPAKAGGASVAEVEQLLASTGLRISCLTCSDNLLEPDEARRGRHWQLLAQTVRAAHQLRVPVVSCRVGRDPSMRLGECIAAWGRLAAETIALATDLGVRLAVDNDPMIGLESEDSPGNLAFSPELWEKIFTHARSETVGLNLDPSHLVWLEVDGLEAVTAYAERIYHVRANDIEIFADRRSDCSILRPRSGWWRHRLPGLGQTDWPKLISRLQEHGYDGALSILYDDSVWSHSQDQVKRGLEFSRRYLERHIV